MTRQNTMGTKGKKEKCSVLYKEERMQEDSGEVGKPTKRYFVYEFSEFELFSAKFCDHFLCTIIPNFDEKSLAIKKVREDLQKRKIGLNIMLNMLNVEYQKLHPFLKSQL